MIISGHPTRYLCRAAIATALQLSVLGAAGCNREPRTNSAAPPAVSLPPAPAPSAVGAPAPPDTDPRTLITVHADGTVTASVAGAPACPTRAPEDCAAELLTRQPALTELTLRADPAVRYQTVIDVADAFRSNRDAAPGPRLSFAAPTNAAQSTCNDTEPPARDAPAVPTEGTSESPQVVVAVSRTMILVGEQVALRVAAFTPEGVEAEHKRCGRHDAFIVPLAKLLPKQQARPDAILVADRDTPYRVVWEVIYTTQTTLRGSVRLTAMRHAP